MSKGNSSNYGTTFEKFKHRKRTNKKIKMKRDNNKPWKFHDSKRPK